MHRAPLALCCSVLGWLFLHGFALAQNSETDASQEQRLTQLESKVADLERLIHQNPIGTTGAGGAAFLCGAFCALWAQNTGRNPWLWFFLGVFLSVIALLILLTKNADDRFSREQVSRLTHGRR